MANGPGGGVRSGLPPPERVMAQVQAIQWESHKVCALGWCNLIMTCVLGLQNRVAITKKLREERDAVLVGTSGPLRDRLFTCAVLFL